MSMNVKKIKSSGGSKFERPPALEAGAYWARVVQIIGLGLQKQQPFKGEEKEPKMELMVTYELADEFMLDEEGNEVEDKPRWIIETFPLNSLEIDLAKSTKRYYALDPKVEHDGDFTKLICSPCNLVLTHSPSKKDPEVVYNNVKDVSAMKSKDVAKMPDLVNDPKVFDPYNPDLEVFQSLPKWVQDKIKESLDYSGFADGVSSEKKEEPKEEPKEGSGEVDW